MGDILFKEADFGKDTLIKAVGTRKRQPVDNRDEKEKDGTPPEAARVIVIRKIVRYVLHLDQKKMNNRKCLSEHPQEIQRFEKTQDRSCILTGRYCIPET
jgi:hypothetical protein